MFDAFVGDDKLQPYVHLQSWFTRPASPEPTKGADDGADRPAAKGLRQQRAKQDVAALVRGETLIRRGNADAELLTTISEAISRYQDRGQTTLVICPDGCGRTGQHPSRAHQSPDLSGAGPGLRDLEGTGLAKRQGQIRTGSSTF